MITEYLTAIPLKVFIRGKNKKDRKKINSICLYNKEGQNKVDR